MAYALGELKLLAPVPHPTTNFAPIWLAKALGYSDDEGLDLRIECVGSPKNAVEGVIAGRGDTTFVNVVFTLLARERGIGLRPYYAFVRTQNRAFSVARDSATKSLSDLRGKTIGLHYDDPELRQFASAALIGASVDPDKDVSFVPLPGSQLDAPRMAKAIRDGEVDAVWQLDVLAGLMEAEGVPLRLLPSSVIDPLTPSSCFNARDENLEARPDAFGALGRAMAKSTLFALTNPEEAIKLLWKRYPESGPAAGEDPARVFKRELAALRIRLAGHRVDAMPDPRWGAISVDEMTKWQDFLLQTRSIGTKRDPSIYFSDALVSRFNDFDAEAVRAQATTFSLEEEEA